MELFWRVYLKTGQTLSFGGKIHHIDIENDVVVRLMDYRYGRTFAIIPMNNILWIETVDPDEGEE